MTKPGVSLLLLWSIWSIAGLGFCGATLDRDAFDLREQRHGENQPVVLRRVAIGRNSDDEDRAPLPLITSTPILPTAAFSEITLPDKPQSDGEDVNDRGQNKERRDDGADDDADTDADDDKPPPSPTIPPGPPLLNGASSSISNSVSSSVSNSVALSVTALFTGSLSAISAFSSSAVVSARAAGVLEGFSSAIAGSTPPGVTGVSPAPSQTASPSTSSSTTSAPAPTTDDASVIASIQTSASRAIEEAQASASSSAQSAVDAANASASAAVANIKASAGDPSIRGSSLTPGQIAGIVISMAFISSLLSALATFLLMRRKTRREDPQSKFESDAPESPQDFRGQGPPQRSRPISQSIRNRLSNRLSQFQMFTALGSTNHERTPPSSHSFIPDVKQRVPPPPDTEHPAMSHIARPVSLSGPDGFDSFMPVSPLSSEGDQSLAPRDSRRISRRDSRPLEPERPPPSPLSVSGPDIRASTTTMGASRVSLAREQSLNGGQRPQLVRVGSSSGREQKDSLAVDANPLAMNPAYVEARYDVPSAPISATGHRHIATFLEPQSSTSEPSTPSSFQVQAPIPRRLVNPGSLEHDPNS
ncbi:hypothetical protein F5Y05DRAFT_411716 [Hypoxylon sp. FL0543]|nr:hypothetical protein F5Y05DRAFT_411716 [Hypoxylon sp. FL0543]